MSKDRFVLVTVPQLGQVLMAAPNVKKALATLIGSATAVEMEPQEVMRYCANGGRTFQVGEGAPAPVSDEAVAAVTNLQPMAEGVSLGASLSAVVTTPTPPAPQGPQVTFPTLVAAPVEPAKLPEVSHTEVTGQFMPTPAAALVQLPSTTGVATGVIPQLQLLQVPAPAPAPPVPAPEASDSSWSALF